jgi:hypothetical protein
MLRLICAFCVCLLAVPGLCDSPSKYQVGTIIEVKPHQSSAIDGNANVVSYDVSVKVGDMIYQTLYTPPFGMNTVKYAAGRDVVVRVGKKTITYSDMLGRPVEVPIVSQKSATDAKLAK